MPRLEESPSSFCHYVDAIWMPSVPLDESLNDERLDCCTLSIIVRPLLPWGLLQPRSAKNLGNLLLGWPRGPHRQADQGESKSQAEPAERAAVRAVVATYPQDPTRPFQMLRTPTQASPRTVKGSDLPAPPGGDGGRQQESIFNLLPRFEEGKVGRWYVRRVVRGNIEQGTSLGKVFVIYPRVHGLGPPRPLVNDRHLFTSNESRAGFINPAIGSPSTSRVSARYHGLCCAPSPTDRVKEANFLVAVYSDIDRGWLSSQERDSLGRDANPPRLLR